MIYAYMDVKRETLASCYFMPPLPFMFHSVAIRFVEKMAWLCRTGEKEQENVNKTSMMYYRLHGPQITWTLLSLNW